MFSGILFPLDRKVGRNTNGDYFKIVCFFNFVLTFYHKDLPYCGWVGVLVGCESIPMSLLSSEKSDMLQFFGWVLFGGFCFVCLGLFFWGGEGGSWCLLLFCCHCFYSYFIVWETFLTRHKLQEIGKRAW